MTTMIRRLTDLRPYRAVRWPTLAAFALVLAYADGFLLTSLQGAIGAIERLEPPFTRWLRDSSAMLPVFFVALLLALAWSRRAILGRRSGLARFALLSLVVTLAGGGVGIGAAVASSVHDYSYQASHLELAHSYGGAVVQPAAVALPELGDAAPLPYSLYCNLRGVAANNAVTLMEYATFMVHVRALLLFGALLLATDLALGVLLVIMLGDWLWSARAAEAATAAEATGQLAAGGTPA